MALRTTPPAFLRRADADKAFERLYERHVRDVYRYAAGMLGATADAEDVTQTTFLNAYRAFKQGTRPEKPKPWLITIAHNVCRQRFRQAQRRPHEVEFDERVGEGTADEITAPTAADLHRALLQLAPNQRAALVMRELEGCSYAEIAEVLGISVSALETVLFRARRALREQLDEQLTCQEAAFAINKQLDGRASRAERRSLRAHLRACAECNSLAQSQRAQRRALKTLVLVPLPASISHWMGGHAAEAATGAAGAGGLTAVAGVTAGGGGSASSVVFGGAAAKVAAIVVAGAVVGGGSYGARARRAPRTMPRAPHRRAAAPVARGRVFETPKRVAPATFIVTRSPQASVHKRRVAPRARRSSRSTSRPSRARRRAQSRTRRNRLASTPPGQAVTALPSGAASSRSRARAQRETRTRRIPSSGASRASGPIPSHPRASVAARRREPSAEPKPATAERPGTATATGTGTATGTANGNGNGNGKKSSEPTP